MSHPFRFQNVSSTGTGAAAFALFLVVGLAALEAAAWLGSGAAALGSDLPVLAEIVVPGLIAIVIQWWLVRRRWRKRQAASAPPL